MSVFDKFIKNCDLGDIASTKKEKKPWVIGDLMENPDEYFALLFTEGDSINLSIRKRPQVEEVVEIEGGETE